ncbi:4-hydroxybenzoyl-CoA thioesterase [Mesorhizobium sp. Root157]|uniref:thioesterase family protein n=1 Tax=Mesorhizobium sp. Root157 TaxID=1736477 RepID=UPI0006F3A588|nr:thioesterase family protein [Mesorhizobium sp. Root157]KQZ82818.1 4-hydroxybenzoyl-CoA thioesterase [Mesorhizobium sp. Root157]
MYVWARLARVVATARSRDSYFPGEESRLAFRCLPSDIDSNLHLNNARYMMLADLGRIDIFVRAGLLGLARKRKWAPMLGGLQVVYAREIRLWQRFEVFSSIETWVGTQVIGRHRFILASGDIAATVMTTAGVYDRDGRQFIPIDDVVAALGQPATPRPLNDIEQAFLKSHQTLRTATKTAPPG